VIIRPERLEDRPSSIEIERAAFGTLEEATIVERIWDEPGSFALVAEEDGEVVGHAQMSTAWIGEDPVLALGPIGVSPA
jgi:putative acetyltransferase